MNPSEIVIKILTVTAEGPKNEFYCTRTSSSLINSVFLMDRVDFVDHSKVKSPTPYQKLNQNAFRANVQRAGRKERVWCQQRPVGAVRDKAM